MRTDLFALAARHHDWLATRQTAVAQNVANANTPGYRAVDAVPFDAVLGGAEAVRLAATAPGHIRPGAVGGTGVALRQVPGADANHSGNTVSMERELMAASEVASAYALDSGVAKAFQRMVLASAKG
jgi:flagellar basal-body rod protein FlgB